MTNSIGTKLYHTFHRLGRKGSRNINKLGRKFIMLHNSGADLFGNDQGIIQGTPFVAQGLGALQTLGGSLQAIGGLGKSIFGKRKRESIEK